MDALPVIDFSHFAAGDSATRHAIAADIDAACRTAGFLFLRGHGVPQPVIDAAFAAARQFFDQPMAQKAAISIAHSPCHRGWFGPGEEALDRARQPEGDLKEGLKIGRDLPANHPRVVAGVPLHGPNQWPEQEGFEAAMTACYAAFEGLSRQLMQAFALALGLPDTHFEPVLSLPMATLGPLRYPPHPSDTDPAAAISAGAHTDFGCLSLLAQADVDGLEIALPDGRWLAVPAATDMLVVNIGDMLARWTNDRYRSTQHRVVNRSGQTRHSLAYFFDPDPDADLTPLPGLLRAGAAPHYPPATCLSHLLAKIDDSFAYRDRGENE